MKTVFNLVFFQPLYNALVFLSAVLPGNSLALSIIILTLAVKTALFPLQHRATRTQAKIKSVEPLVKKIRESRADRTDQAKKILELYRRHGINPFSGFWLILVQLPILFALFFVFKDSFELHPELIYSFISSPAATDHTFFGLIDLAKPSYLLALLAGLSQFIQAQLAVPPSSPRPASGGGSWREEMARGMNVQIRYILPAVVGLFALQFPSALALYWTTSNCFTIVHEWRVRKKAKCLESGEPTLESGSQIKRP